MLLPSVLWRCWLGGRKGILPVKTEWWGAGVVICLERDADLHMAQLMPLPLTVSCFSKIPFWYRLTRVVPDKGPLNGCVCVCVWRWLADCTQAMLCYWLTSNVFSLVQCQFLRIPAVREFCKIPARVDHKQPTHVRQTDVPDPGFIKGFRQCTCIIVVCFLEKLLLSVHWRCWLGGRKGVRRVKNWSVGCWRGYLSGARCWLAYGPADATATHCLLLQYNPDWFYLSGTGSPG